MDIDIDVPRNWNFQWSQCLYWWVPWAVFFSPDVFMVHDQQSRGPPFERISIRNLQKNHRKKYCKVPVPNSRYCYWCQYQFKSERCQSVVMEHSGIVYQFGKFFFLNSVAVSIRWIQQECPDLLFGSVAYLGKKSHIVFRLMIPDFWCLPACLAHMVKKAVQPCTDISHLNFLMISDITQGEIMDSPPFYYRDPIIGDFTMIVCGKVI